MIGHLVVARVAVAVGAVIVAIALPAAPHAIGAALPSGDAGQVVAGGPARPSGVTLASGVTGTTVADLSVFAAEFNAQRAEHDLRLLPVDNFRYDPCMEQRLFWIAEDPSTSVASAWGHTGTTRSDGVPSVGCDGNLAGGTNNTGGTVAAKWWNSLSHRDSLYKPFYLGSLSSVCIFFAMTHGGVPDEPAAFTRAAARWGSC